MQIYAFLTTPFTANGNFDQLAFQKYLEFLCDSGLDGFGLLGPIGEGIGLGLATKQDILSTVQKVVTDQKIGYTIMNNSLEMVEEEMKMAINEGVDFFLVVPPAFYATSLDILENYYMNLYQKFAKDIYLLNIPRLIGRFFTPEEIERLLKLNRLTGICDVSGERKIRTMLYKNDKKFIEGHAPSILESNIWGLDGFMTVTAGLFPKLHLAFKEDLNFKNFIEARQKQELITRVSKIIHLPGRPVCVGVKYLLSLMGFYEPALLPPLAPPSVQEKKKLKRELKEIQGYLE